MRDEKLPAVATRSKFRSQNAQNTWTLEHFWKLRFRKSARRSGAKHIWKSKCAKHTNAGALLEVELSKKCAPLWRKAHFQVKMYKTFQCRSTFGSWAVEKMHAVVAKHMSKSKCTKHHARTTFRRSDVVSRGRRKGLCTLSKVRNVRVLWQFQKRWQAWIFEEDLQRCILHGRRNTRDTWIRYVRRSGRWFPERLLLEHQSSGLLRWFCGTGAALLMAWPSLFRGRRSTLRQVEWKNRKTNWYEAVSSALNFPFFKEISQNCCVLDVVNFRNWGNLAELLRFGWCQVPKLRKSCRIAAFLMLSSTKNQEVSQNSFVLKLSDRQINR